MPHHLVIEQNDMQKARPDADLLPGIGPAQHSSIPNSGAASAPVTSYVSLFLLMLVFFSVLFSIASVQHDRSKAILSSLDEAFAHLPSRLGLIAPESGSPGTTPGVEISQTLNRIFKPFAAASAVLGPSQDGMAYMALGAEKLFIRRGDRLDAQAFAALDQFAVVLQHPVAGARIRVTLHAGPVTAPGEENPAATLAIARLSTIATYLFDKGAPPDAIAITQDATLQGIIVATAAPIPAISADEQN